MNPSPCSTHGDLVRNLALGALGDADSQRAEQALAGCGRCRDWWRGTLEVEAVERGVAEALAAFRPPAHSAAAPQLAGRRWARLAAAAALLAGGGAAWLATGGRLDSGASGDPAARSAERRGGVESTTTPEATGAAPSEAGRGEILLADGLESGTLDAWQVYTSTS